MRCLTLGCLTMKYSTRWLITALTLCLIAIQQAQANNLVEPFGEHQKGLLFSLQGSNTVGAQMAPSLVRDYLASKGLTQVSIKAADKTNEYRISGYHPKSKNEIYVDLAAHGSSTGFRGLLKRQTDIAMSSRAIKNKEVEALSELGAMQSFNAEKVIAIDGLAIIVHPKNPIYKLTIAQIRDLFSGAINNWQQLGGDDQKVQLYARDNNSGTWDTFKNLVLAKQAQLHSSAQRFESNDELAKRVERDRGGIGFVALASIGGTQALAVADKNTRALLPTRLSVATEDYPLSRRLYLYVSPHNTNAFIKEFLQFAQGEQGQAIVEKSGYISQTPVLLVTPELTSAPARYTELTKNAQRLSINIRFNSGSATLDNKALQDVLRLSQFMNKHENSARKILLIGFGDSKSSEKRAKVLSKLRAIAVRSELREQGIHTLPVEGLGDELPVANNQSNSKLKNQRVEIWLI